MEPVTYVPPYVRCNEASLNPITEKFKAAVKIYPLSKLARLAVRKNIPFNPSYFIRLAWVMGNKGALEKAIREFRILRQKTSIEHLQEELEAYKSLETLNDDLRDELRYEFAPYFGEMIEMAPIDERDKLFEMFSESGIESLSLEGRDIKDIPYVLSKIGQIASLKHLNLSHLHLRGADLGKLPKTMHYLNLSFCELENEDIICLPHAEELILYGNDKLTDEGLKCIPKAVKVLSLCQCTGIKGSGLKDLGSNLEALFLDGCLKVSDKDMAGIPKSVKILSLSFSDITDEGLKDISNDVEELVLWNCRRVTDEGIAHLPAQLRNLNIAYTSIEGALFINLPTTVQKVHHSIGPLKSLYEYNHHGRTISLVYIGEA